MAEPGENIGKDLTSTLSSLASVLDVQNKIVRQTEQWRIDQDNINRALGMVQKEEAKILATKQKMAEVWKKIKEASKDLADKILLRVKQASLSILNIMIRWQNRLDEIAKSFRLASDSLKNQVGYFKALDVSMKKIGAKSFALFNEDVQFAADMMAALVEEFGSPNVTEFADTMFTITKGFGLGNKEGARLLQTLTLGFGMTTKEIARSMGELKLWSKEMGMSHVLIAKDMGDNIDFFARFGDQAIKTFKSSTLYASNFGLRMKELIKLSEKFDSFSDAAGNVQKLNAMFGTTLNTVEMIMETDPGKRLAKIRDALMTQGKSWENLDYYQRKSLTSYLGLEEAELSAILNKKNEKISIEDAMKAREKEAAGEKKATKAFTNATREMANLFQRYFGRTGMFTKLFDKIGEALMPLWKGIFGGEKSLVKALTAFFAELAKGDSPRAKRFVGFLSEMGTWIKSLYERAQKYLFGEDGFLAEGNFQKIIDAASRAFGGIKTIGETIITIFDKLKPPIQFMVEHFDLILLGAGAISLALGGWATKIGAAVVGFTAFYNMIDEVKGYVEREDVGAGTSMAARARAAKVKSLKEEGLTGEKLAEEYRKWEKMTFKAKDIAVPKPSLIPGKRRAGDMAAEAKKIVKKDLSDLKGIDKAVLKDLSIKTPEEATAKFGSSTMKSEMSLVRSNIVEFQRVLAEIKKTISLAEKMPATKLAKEKLVDISTLAPALAMTAEAYKSGKVPSGTTLGATAAKVSENLYVFSAGVFLDSVSVGNAIFGSYVNK